MDWKKIAEQRLDLAQRAVREAKGSLTVKNKDSHVQYERALKELAAAERFLVRVARNEPMPLEEGQGLFG